MNLALSVMSLALLTVFFAGCTAPSSDEEPATLGSQLATVYQDHPLGGGQQTPAHLFFVQPDGSFLFFHMDNDEAEKADGVLFVGDAFPGKFCNGDAGATQAEIDAGYIHFHKKTAANWDAGHGGGPTYAAAQDGYWFRHVGAMTGSMVMMGQTMQVQDGEVFPLMPSDQIPECP